MSDFVKGLVAKAESFLGNSAPDSPSGSQANSLVSSLLDHVGGIDGLLDQAEKHGIGDKVRSWISAHGDNLPISAEEVEKLIPADKIDSFAVSHGIPAGSVSSIIAHVLPSTVDQKTPGGSSPPT